MQNIEQLNRIQELQKRIRELEAMKDPNVPEKDRIQMLTQVSNERDDLKKKLKIMEEQNEKLSSDNERNAQIVKLSEEKALQVQGKTSEISNTLQEQKDLVEKLQKEKEGLIQQLNNLKQSEEKGGDEKSKLKSLTVSNFLHFFWHSLNQTSNIPSTSTIF